MDTLQYLLDRQRKFEQDLISLDQIADLAYQQSQLKEYSLALIVEVTEFLAEINWKPWKKTQKDVDCAKVKEEFIDILHFFLILALLLDLDATEIKTIYDKKMAINEARQKSGY